MAVISAVKVYDVDNESICKVLRAFGGVEHRIEYVTTIDGVDYYNDSKATNCESTKIALKSFNQPTLLILGGLDRGHSFDDLTPCMENVTYVACYGETKARIKEYCDRIGKDCGDSTFRKGAKECKKTVPRPAVHLSRQCRGPISRNGKIPYGIRQDLSVRTN